MPVGHACMTKSQYYAFFVRNSNICMYIAHWKESFFFQEDVVHQMLQLLHDSIVSFMKGKLRRAN